MSATKYYHLVSLLSVDSEIFEKPVNVRFADHLGKCGIFSDFQYGFRSSSWTADFLTVVSDIVARTFNKSEATWGAALDMSKAFGRVCHPAEWKSRKILFRGVLSFITIGWKKRSIHANI